MARTSKKQPPLGDILDTIGAATQEELELDEFLDEIGPSVAVIHVLRLKSDGSRPQCGKTTMEQIREDPWEYLRTTFGPGRYMLMFRGSDRRIAGSKTLEVEGVTNTVTPAASNHNNNSLFPPDMSFQDKMLMMRFMIPEKPAVDFGAIMAGMGSMMVAMRPGEGPKPADPVEMFRTCMQMFQGMNKPDKTPLEQLREVAGVIKEFSGDKGGSDVDSPWGMIADVGKEVVNKIGPALTGMMPGGQSRPAPVVPGTGQPARVALPAGAVVPQSQPQNPQENLQRWLQVQISLFKEKAKAGKDPGFWIDYVFENAEEPGIQAITYAIREYHIKQNIPFDNLLAFDPEIAENPQLLVWFREVFEGVKAGLLQGDVDSGGEGGDPRDVVSNAGSSSPGQPPVVSSTTGTNVP